jgi:hypothetical protein
MTETREAHDAGSGTREARDPNLFDMQARYRDVMGKAEVIQKLNALPR